MSPASGSSSVVICDWSEVLDPHLTAQQLNDGWLIQRFDCDITSTLAADTQGEVAQLVKYHDIPVGIWLPNLAANGLKHIPRQQSLQIKDLQKALFWLDWPLAFVHLDLADPHVGRLVKRTLWLAQRKTVVRGENMDGGRALLFHRLFTICKWIVRPRRWSQLRQEWCWERHWYQIQKSHDRQLIEYLRSA